MNSSKFYLRRYAKVPKISKKPPGPAKANMKIVVLNNDAHQNHGIQLLIQYKCKKKYK